MKKTGMKKIGVIACLVIVICLFSFSTAMADWYNARIVSINTRPSSDDVIVQVVSADTPALWTGEARVVLLGGKPGSNQVLATMLTALGLDYNVKVRTTSQPSSTAQNLLGCIIVAP